MSTIVNRLMIDFGILFPIRTSNLQGNRSDLLFNTYIRCSIETYRYDQHVVHALYILIFDLILCNNYVIKS